MIPLLVPEIWPWAFFVTGGEVQEELGILVVGWELLVPVFWRLSAWLFFE